MHNLFLVVFSSIPISTHSQECSSTVCIPGGYNKIELPALPVHVETTIFLLDIFSVHPETFTLDVSLYISLWWKDKRIQSTGDKGSVEVQKGFFEKVWKPDLTIWNLNGEKPYSERLTRETGMFYTDGNCTLWVGHSFEIDIGVVCPMDFSRFPFDTNECEIRLSSFTHEDENKINLTVTPEDYHPSTRLDMKTIRDYNIEVAYLTDTRMPSRNYPGDYMDSAPGLKLVLTTRPGSFLADPGKARGCSTNTSVTDELIK